MRAKSVIFFMLLTGLSFTIVKGDGPTKRGKCGEDYFLEQPSCTNPHCPGIFFSTTLAGLSGTLGELSGPFLLKRLQKLVREHPMQAMALAIVIGVITYENKENIFEGIKKLRNSAYRVMGFGLKSNEENDKDEQKKEMKFISGNFFVSDA